jgi:hypothetical protein
MSRLNFRVVNGRFNVLRTIESQGLTLKRVEHFQSSYNV